MKSRWILVFGAWTFLSNPISGLATTETGGSGPKVPCTSNLMSRSVEERDAPNTVASWRISITGEHGEEIASLPVTAATNRGGAAFFTIPAFVNQKLSCDAKNQSIILPPGGGGGGGGGGRGGGRPRPPNPRDPNPFPRRNPNPLLPDGFGEGATSILNIESLWLDPETDQWTYEGVWDQIVSQFGSGPVAINIPDLFADTNGDGTIGYGDVLYSWVDLRTYMEAIPTFSLADRFSIVDGKVDGLEGMWFSSTPIYLDPVLGPRPSGGEWFNEGLHATSIDTAGVADFGNSVALTAHTFGVNVPEPPTWMTLAAGITFLAAALRRKRRIENP